MDYGLPWDLSQPSSFTTISKVIFGSARLYWDQQGYIRISKVIFRSPRLYLTWVGAKNTCVSKNQFFILIFTLESESTKGASEAGPALTPRDGPIPFPAQLPAPGASSYPTTGDTHIPGS